MLNENIKTIRKNKGFSQEELAVRLHVTRQTISKWEKGLSVPDATLLTDMAEILDVSVSELLGEAKTEHTDQDALIEQLSRINEQMAIRNRRASRIIKVLALSFLIVIIALLLVFILELAPHSVQYSTSDHLGHLTYIVPDPEFAHGKDDIGVTIEDDGRWRISAKVYKMYSDMMQLTVMKAGKITPTMMDEFREEYSGDLVEFSDEHGPLPDVIDEIIAATDETDEYIGTYYRSLLFIGDEAYIVEVRNGSDPIGIGEMLITSIDIDNSKKEEYRKSA